MQLVVHNRRYVASAGSVVVIPAGTPHAAGNAGKELAKVIEIYAPAGSDFHIQKPPDLVTDDASGKEIVCEFKWDGA
jgi:mannose-6-phosphate isomerase-like protein (cupin superfamily)